MTGDSLPGNAEAASALLKALANEHRLMILCNLVDRERNVSELEEILGIRQPTLSQQLARLRAEGLVDSRREAKAVFYRLASEEARQVIGLLYGLFCDIPETGEAPAAAAD